MAEKILIINADDYGVTPQVSKGIRECHDHGVLTSTTAMMNVGGTVTDLRRARIETPDMGLGVHLVMTGGTTALSPSCEIRTIVDEHGSFVPTLEQFYSSLETINPEHVYLEWKRQIEKMLEAGFVPDHLDSHHHASYRNRATLEPFMALAREYNLPVRRAPAKWASVWNDAETVRTTDMLETNFFGSAFTLNGFKAYLDNLTVGTHEVMVHPGHNDERLAKLSSYTIGRENEHKIITSPVIVRAVAANNIQLKTFREVFEAEHAH